MKSILILIASVAFAQTPAVFNDFSANTKGMTIGASHCYIWARLPSPWPMICACYVGGTIKAIQALVDNASLDGEFDSADGRFTWLVTPNGSGSYWQMTAQPVGGVAIYKEGQF